MFIRLIHFGRMLEDKHPLKGNLLLSIPSFLGDILRFNLIMNLDCRLNQDTPNVVHMTVRPPEVGDDEMTQRSAKGLGRAGDNGNGGSTPSCRCVIL